VAKYLLLIYGQEPPAPPTPAQMEAMFNEYEAFTVGIQKQGILRGAEALEPTAAATTVRVRDGKSLVTDGPFAETKEALGGFYLIECDDLDTALAAAARIPGAKTGSIEVRPIVPMPEPAG
jgi:hypothetical protein